LPLAPDHIERLKPYEPGSASRAPRFGSELVPMVSLASNENPRGCSPLALEAVRTVSSVNRYPDGGQRIRTRLAQMHGVTRENVIMGNGSDSIMGNILRTFVWGDDEILATEATFSGFRVLAAARGGPYRTIPYRNWSIDLEAMAAAITDRTKIIYLPNPNNPTGTMFARTEFDAFYRQVPKNVLIVLDQAYYEYAVERPEYPRGLDDLQDNIIVLRTFSKAYGLAGLRIGYGFGSPAVVQLLLKTKLPFEPSVIAEAAGLAALEDTEFLRETVELNAHSRGVLGDSLRELGYTVVASTGNFVMLVFDKPAEADVVLDGLLRFGIVVRPLRSFGLPNCVRIATGTAEEMALCIDTMRELQRVIA